MKRHLVTLLVIVVLAIGTSGCIGEVGPDLDKLGVEVTLNQFFAAIEEQNVELIRGSLTEEVFLEYVDESDKQRDILDGEEIAANFIFRDDEEFRRGKVIARLDKRTYRNVDPYSAIGELFIQVMYEPDQEMNILGQVTIALVKKDNLWKITGFSYGEFELETYPDGYFRPQ